MGVSADAALADRQKLNPEEDRDRERRRGVEVGGRRAAERQPIRLEKQQAELIEDPDEEKDPDEDRHESLALGAKRPDRKIGEEVDDPFERRLQLVDTIARIRATEPK